MGDGGDGRLGGASATCVPPPSRPVVSESAKHAYAFALCCLDGRGVARDVGRAVALLEQAAEGGLGVAQLRLALTLASGESAGTHTRDVVHWLEQAALGGEERASLPLAKFAPQSAVLARLHAEAGSRLLDQLAEEQRASEEAAGVKREKQKAARRRSRADGGLQSTQDGSLPPPLPSPPPSDQSGAARAAARAQAEAAYEAALEARRAELALLDQKTRATALAAELPALAEQPEAPPAEQAQARPQPPQEVDLAAALASREESARLRNELAASQAEASQLRRATLGLAAINRTLSAVQEGLCICNQNAVVIFVNNGFSKVTGYPKDECLGRNCKFLQGVGTDLRTCAALHAAVSEGRSLRVDILNYRKDGTAFWNDLSISPVQADGGGVVRYYVGIQSDVTRRYGGAAVTAAQVTAQDDGIGTPQGGPRQAAPQEAARLLDASAVESLLQLEFVESPRLFCDFSALG